MITINFLLVNASARATQLGVRGPKLILAFLCAGAGVFSANWFASMLVRG